VSVPARRADTPEPSVCVSVTDSGVGIPPEEMSRVFDYLYQGTNTAELARKGFGIGLHVCKNFVERHDGRLWADSRVGGGSTFSFTLPMAGEGAA
jgi:signal transduction histidine kinase